MEDRDMIIGFIDKQKETAATMKDASAEINIIAINAAIESAHAASGIRIMTEKILDIQMTSNCRLLASVLANGGFTLDQPKIAEYARWINVDEIYITDEDAVTVGSNIEAAYGWRFPDDPKAQAYAFRKLITQEDGVFTQPIQTRDIDNLMFKFVGVSRIDQPGIVQVGYKAESIAQYQSEIGAVFGVLADAISTLGGKVTRTAKGMLDSIVELEKGLG
jgi:methyl-accepting chemotaxis protein